MTKNKESINIIQKKVKKYLSNNNMKCVVIGISGGFDSAFNAALLKPICDELNIPIIGRYIHIESNKEDEKQRACNIGKAFCSDFKCVDLTNLFYTSLKDFEEGEIFDDNDYTTKIRRGNIKARMRMIYLYNLASLNKGLVIDNDNKTEILLGFYTLNGSCDLSPLSSLFKTEAYELAKIYAETINDNDAKQALINCINAVPTDGLGITSSDVEQFGVKSYAEVDEILFNFLYRGMEEQTLIIEKYGQEVYDKVINRFKNNFYKTEHPKRININ